MTPSEKLTIAIEKKCKGQKDEYRRTLAQHLGLSQGDPRAIYIWEKTRSIPKTRIPQLAEFFNVDKKLFTDENIDEERWEQIIKNADQNNYEIILTIKKPNEDQPLPHTVEMEGTVYNFNYGQDLWIVKEPHPNNYHPDRGPVSVVNNNWKGISFIGNNSINADTGNRFKIHVVICSLETGRRFNEYIDNAHRSGAFYGLSTIYDGRILASVNVIRNDSVWENSF